MKIIALLSLGLTGADFLVAATPVDHRATKASHKTFLKATDAEDVAIGQQWYLDQQNRTDNVNGTHHERNIVGAAHYQVQCATQQTIDADDFAKAKQELMDCESISFLHVLCPSLPIHPSLPHLLLILPCLRRRGPSLFTSVRDSPTIPSGIEVEPRRTAHSEPNT